MCIPTSDKGKAYDRDDLVSKIKQALEDGLDHPHQPNLVAIEGELDLDELAEFVAEVLMEVKWTTS
jgi:hypothetical protein